MEFTREQYDNLPARQVNDFKKFVLDRFCAYTKYTSVVPARYLGGPQQGRPIQVDTPRDDHGWGGWMVVGDLFTDDDFFAVCHYLDDERAPRSYSAYVELPKAFVFGKLEEDAEYQEYLRLKEKFEGGK